MEVQGLLEYNNFLDAGAGIGNIMAIANKTLLAKYCSGIEFNKQTFVVGQKFLGHSSKKCKLLFNDVMTYKSYNKFDIIYYYCPLKNYMLEFYFEEKVEDEMDVGSILIPRFKQNRSIYKDKRFKCIHLKIYTDDNRFTAAVCPFFIKISDSKRTISEFKRDHKQFATKDLPEKYKPLIEERYQVKYEYRNN